MTLRHGIIVERKKGRILLHADGQCFELSVTQTLSLCEKLLEAAEETSREQLRGLIPEEAQGSEPGGK